MISKIISTTLLFVQISGVVMLNSEAIRKHIEKDELISNYIDLEKQLQPSGFDISIKEVYEYVGAGSVDFSNKERKIADTKVLKPNTEGWYNLKPGCFIIVYNEVVKMPLDVVAIARSRSTLLRNGASMETAVWDPGYHGRSSSLLVVHNPFGINLKKDARVAQLIFFKIKKVEKGYSGVYQNERIR
jgi:dUTP pyrophosphatase